MSAAMIDCEQLVERPKTTTTATTRATNTTQKGAERHSLI